MTERREPGRGDPDQLPPDPPGASSDELIRHARDGLGSPAPGGTTARILPPTESGTGPAAPELGAGDPFGRAPGGGRSYEDLSPRPPTTAPTKRMVAVLVAAAVVAIGAVAAVAAMGVFGSDDEEPRSSSPVEEATRETLEGMGVRAASIDCVVGQLHSRGAFATLEDVNPKVVDLDPSGVAMPAEMVPFMESFFATLPECLTATELEAVATAPATDGPLTLGDSAELDTLWSFCDAGDFEACDLLYIVSPVGSDYEAFGAACGDRGTDIGLPCVVALGEGPDLDAWEQRCTAGDFGACDLLFLLSAADSDQERFGATCGNRNEASDMMRCTMRYGLGPRP